MRAIIFALILSMSTIAQADPLDDFAEWFVQFDRRHLEMADSAIENCSEDTARRVDFRELVATSMFRYYECVTVHGLASNDGAGLNLYPDWQSFYYAGVAAAALSGSSDGEANPFAAHVELPERLAVEFSPGFHEVEITGTVIDCYSVREYYRRKEAVVNQALEDSALIHIGMCAFLNGLTLHAVEIEVGERRQFPRLPPRPENADFRSLWPIPPDWEVASIAEQAFALYLSSLVSGQTAAGFEQITTESFLEQIGRGELEYRADLSGGGAILRTLSPTAQPAIFWISDEEYSREPRLSDRELGLTIIACYCLAENCEGRWPISLSDATRDERRPYVCVEGWLKEERGVPRFDDISLLNNMPASPFFEPSAGSSEP